MSEILVKTTVLEDEIKNLQQLGVKVILTEKKPPNIVGNGKSIQDIKQLCKLYQQMHKDLSILISNTIQTLQNINDNYIASDKMAKEKFNK